MCSYYCTGVLKYIANAYIKEVSFLGGRSHCMVRVGIFDVRMWVCMCVCVGGGGGGGGR